MALNNLGVGSLLAAQFADAVRGATAAGARRVIRVDHHIVTWQMRWQGAVQQA
jgi:hypothetical protein